MAETTGICEAFVAVCELGEALGVQPLNQHAGCWEHNVDARWKIAVNGHGEPVLCGMSDVPIAPFTCYVMFNGWPAGIITPYGGTIAAGEAANEDAFIAAVRAAIGSATTDDTAKGA
mgnify:CR=1 FL=1